MNEVSWEYEEIHCKLRMLLFGDLKGSVLNVNENVPWSIAKKGYRHLLEELEHFYFLASVFHHLEPKVIFLILPSKCPSFELYPERSATNPTHEYFAYVSIPESLASDLFLLLGMLFSDLPPEGQLTNHSPESPPSDFLRKGSAAPTGNSSFDSSPKNTSDITSEGSASKPPPESSGNGTSPGISASNTPSGSSVSYLLLEISVFSFVSQNFSLWSSSRKLNH